MTNFPNRGFYRGNIELALKDLGIAIVPDSALEDYTEFTDGSYQVGATTIPSVGTLTKEAAKSSGYTGDQCTNCNSMRMKVAGHCMVCEDCGTTTGCS